MAPGPPHLVRTKTRIPALAPVIVPRERILDVLARAADGRRVLEVVAAAGSGKTTAVVQFLESRGGPSAWLTLGEADGSPGRFVAYLAAALDDLVPAASDDTRAQLAAGMLPAGCAAGLVTALPEGAALVIDDVHLVEDRPPVLAVLRALVAAVPPGALLVLVARRPVPVDLGPPPPPGLAGRVTGQDLAFTPEEAGTFLDAHGVGAGPADGAPAPGGWAAGIVFEALRRARPGPAADDAFLEYIGSEVLRHLGGDVRDAVVRSAVLDVVEPRGLARILDAPTAEAAFREIVRQQLPGTAEREGLRYHPRFREYLLGLLDRDPALRRSVLLRDAARLRDGGDPEAAADRFLQAGALDEAAEAVGAVGEAVVGRGDWQRALRWCEALGEEVMARRPAVRGVHLQAVLAGRRQELPGLADRLVASGEFARLAEAAPRVAAAASLGVHLTGDWRRAARLLPADDTSPAVWATRYVYEVGSGDRPPRPWPQDVPPDDPIAIAALECGLHLQGRLGEMDTLRAAPAAQGAPSVHLVGGLRERGRLGDARMLLEESRASAWAPSWRDLLLHAEGEQAFAEGDRQRGLALVREARLVARARGHQPADRACFAAGEGRMLVRMGRVDEAARVLRDAMAWSQERGLPCFREWSATWLAAARLAREEDADAVSGLLHDAIAGMDRAGRRLEQPAALVLLAEARRRRGDLGGHDAAADRAFSVSEAMGTLAPLLTALEQAPEVLARCCTDAAGDRGADWRALARLREPPVAPTGTDRARIVIRTLGRLRLEVDGVECDVKPARALDVAARIARAGSRGVARADLVALLAGHSVDPHNYLRQLVHRLRRIAPEGVELRSEGGRLRWSPPCAVVAEDDVLWSLLAQAGRDTGAVRRRTLAAALTVAGRGTLVGADDRRTELEAAVAEARREHARLLSSRDGPALLRPGGSRTAAAV